MTRLSAHLVTIGIALANDGIVWHAEICVEGLHRRVLILVLRGLIHLRRLLLLLLRRGAQLIRSAADWSTLAHWVAQNVVRWIGGHTAVLKVNF